MLKSIIENNQINFRIKPQHLVYTGATVFTHCHSYLAAEFLINLVWFITYIKGGRPTGCKNETFGFTLIASAQHTYPVFIAQQIYYILGVRCLTRATNPDIADHYDRHRKFPLFQYMPFKHKISNPDTKPIEFRHRKQKQIGYNLVFRHLFIFCVKTPDL